MTDPAQRTSAEIASDSLSDFRESAEPGLPRQVTEEVVRYYSSMVYRIALTKTKSQSDAEDIFQEVFLKLLTTDKAFASEEHRKAWLIRVTVNCCNSHFVAPWRRNLVSIDEIAEVAGEMTPEDAGVYARVLALPAAMRDAVLLFYYEDLSVREIAAATGTTEANVKKRLSRAREKLRLEITEK